MIVVEELQVRLTDVACDLKSWLDQKSIQTNTYRSLFLYLMWSSLMDRACCLKGIQLLKLMSQFFRPANLLDTVKLSLLPVVQYFGTYVRLLTVYSICRSSICSQIVLRPEFPVQAVERKTAYYVGFRGRSSESNDSVTVSRLTGYCVSFVTDPSG